MAIEQITKAGAKRFLAACRENGIELVPQFMCLGHQSWAKNTQPLLTKYPELDLTPGAFPNNKGIYCREWDPMNPKTNEIVFALIDELIDAFEAKAFHVGMDEVFLLSSEHAPSTKDLDPADVFAKVVNDLHGHIVGEARTHDADVGRPADRRRAIQHGRMGGVESRHGAGSRQDSQGHHSLPVALRAARAIRIAADVHGEGLSHSAGELEEDRGHAGAHSRRAGPSSRRPARRPHLHDLVAAARRLGRIRAAWSKAWQNCSSRSNASAVRRYSSRSCRLGPIGLRQIPRNQRGRDDCGGDVRQRRLAIL